MNTNGTPKVDFGVGGSAAWNAAAAPSGTYTNYVVSAVGANSFQACNVDGSKCYTFMDNVSGSTYADQITGSGTVPLSMAQFQAFVSGPVNNPANVPDAIGDEVTINYNANGPSSFTFSTSTANSLPSSTPAAASGEADVPGAPTGVTATYNATNAGGTGSAGVALSWTAPGNIDVGSYQVWRAPVSSTTGKAGTYTQATGSTTTNCSPDSSTCTVDVPATAGTYSYVVIALNNESFEGAASTPVQATVPTAAAPAVTGPLSKSTNTVLATAGSLAQNDTVDVFFNTTVTIASNWSLEIADDTGNIVLLNSTNSTASTAAGGTEAIIQINKGAPIVVSGIDLVAGGGVWEILDQGGFTSTATATPAWNLEGSGASAGTVNEGGTAVSVTRELAAAGGATAGDNSGLPTKPTVTINSDGTWNYTCNTGTDVINVYNAAGSFLGSQACADTTAHNNQTAPTGVTFTSGSTYQFTESTSAHPAYGGQESATNPELAP